MFLIINKLKKKKFHVADTIIRFLRKVNFDSRNYKFYLKLPELASQ